MTSNRSSMKQIWAKSAKLILTLLASVAVMWATGCSQPNMADAMANSQSMDQAIDFSEENLALNNGQYAVPAILCLPLNGGKPVPAVLMLHGTASQKNEVGGLYRRLAHRLAKAGLASIRIDFAGSGDSPVDYRDYTLESARRDGQTALNYLQHHPAIQANALGIIGFSQGGLIAQLMAVDDSKNHSPAIKTMVTWSSTAGDGIGSYRFIYDQYAEEAKENGYAVVKFAWREAPLNFSRQWFEQIAANTSLSDMGAYQGSLLAIAGSADPLVDFHSSLKLVQASGSQNAVFYLIKDADHMFNVLGNPATSNGLNPDQSQVNILLAQTTRWFVQQLNQ